ncbi:uncharacterized protein LOC119723833 [Patiria miniata]|uniref:Uncharacterized protein n=1 Tax=Patiria miniata TaxID=46514 RepID=A0A913ZFS1_PATMI|nr:uncharacterized protein LOC119723833 [Patiria miniata]
MMCLNLTVIAVLLFLGTRGANAQCYNCSHSEVGQGMMETGQKGCADPFIASGIDRITCNGKCTKTKMVMQPSPDGRQPAMYMISRSCSPHGAPCVEGDQVLMNNATMSQFCCTGALCNGQGMVGFSGLLGLLALLTTAAIFY